MAATIANELSGAMSTVVLPLIVLSTTHSPALAGIAVASSTAGLIISQIFAGTVVDRFSPARILRVSSLTQAVGWLVVCSAVLFAPTCFSPILIGAVLAGGASGFDGPSEHTLIKVIVPKESLGRATAVSQGREATAGLLGGPIAGALYAVSGVLALATQTILHLLASIVAPPARRPRREGGESFIAELKAGFRIVLKHPGLRSSALVAGIANFPVVALPLALLTHYEHQGVPSLLLGVLTSSFGVGILIGSFFAGSLSTRFRLGRLGITAIGCFALGQVLIILTFEEFWLTCAILAASALPLPAFNAAIGAYTAAITPEPLMGRVVSATGVPGMLLMPVGSLFAGVSLQQWGMFATVAVSALIAVTSAMVMGISPALRQIPLLSQLKEEVIQD